MRALAWIRKSKGSDDDIGLEEQRAAVRSLAEDVADDYDVLDLGVQTGFSSLTRDGSGLLDKRQDVQNALERIRMGEYDYIVALDDRRVCRDGYFEVIKYAMKDGSSEFVYVRDVHDDELTHDIKRRVERDTKEEEIEKSRQAIEARKERGYDHGRPKFGMTYDDAGHYQVPGEDFDRVEEIFERREDGDTYAEIGDAVDAAPSTVRNVVNNRDWYADRSDTLESQK